MNYNNLPSNPHQKLEAYMKRVKYSQRTIDSYFLCIQKVIKSSGKDCYHLTVEDFNNHIDSVIGFLSISYINAIINAGKLYLKYGLEKSDYVLKKFERPKKAEYIPDILSQEEIRQVINSFDNIKHKALIAFIYCHGLRISECINFKINHFDRSRKIIKIVQSKGAKDRIIELNTDCRDILVKYWMQYNPKVYLFNGQNSDQYSTTSIRCILNAALKRCNITKDIHVHSLRHSFATHLYENGVPIEQIQKILGHSQLKTSMIYTRISTKNIYQLKLVV
jgi:site-specific recombinase XerD